MKRLGVDIEIGKSEHRTEPVKKKGKKNIDSPKKSTNRTKTRPNWFRFYTAPHQTGPIIYIFLFFQNFKI